MTTDKAPSAREGKVEQGIALFAEPVDLCGLFEAKVFCEGLEKAG